MAPDVPGLGHPTLDPGPTPACASHPPEQNLYKGKAQGHRETFLKALSGDPGPSLWSWPLGTRETPQERAGSQDSTAGTPVCGRGSGEKHGRQSSVPKPGARAAREQDRGGRGGGTGRDRRRSQSTFSLWDQGQGRPPGYGGTDALPQPGNKWGSRTQNSR